MPTKLDGRIFRVFVSSTFRDMSAERDALQREVFPYLEQYCAERGARFQAIDLRWGVNEEAAIDQRTMPICLEELRRCQETTPRPHFLILLGNRYGWRPLPGEIESSEFNSLLIAADSAQRSLLLKWYRRDDNALPSQYLLLPRTGAFVDHTTWTQEESLLHAALLQASQTALPAGDSRRLKYDISATHQEILHGALHDTNNTGQALCFIRNIELAKDQAPPTDFFDVDSTCRLNDYTTSRVSQLKHTLHARLTPYCYTYTATCTGTTISLSHIAQLCADAKDALTAIITIALNERSAPSLIELEQHVHDSLVASHTALFVRRQSIQLPLSSIFDVSDVRPHFIVGPPGSGKSAFVAHIVAEVRRCLPHAVAVARFVGASSSSTAAMQLIEHLCMYVEQAYGITPQSQSRVSFSALKRRFQQCTSHATPTTPLFIAIDGLEQLSDVDQVRCFNLLRSCASLSVRVVMSCSDHGHTGYATDHGATTIRLLTMGRLSRDEGLQLLAAWLQLAKRTLSQPQSTALLALFDISGSPLYLRLASHFALGWTSHYDPLAVDLPDNTAQLLEYVFTRLESLHGRALVARTLSYIYAARYGLSEIELLRLLPMNDDVMEELRCRSTQAPNTSVIPPVIWSRLLHDLIPFLSERFADESLLLTFSNTEVEEAVQRRYHAGTTFTDARSSLSRFFHAQPTSWRHDSIVPNGRKLSELPRHLSNNQEWRLLKQLFGDLEYFRHAWDYDSREVVRIWALIEQESPYRCADTYRAVLDSTAAYDAVTLADLRSLFLALGQTDHALRLLNLTESHANDLADADILALVMNEKARDAEQAGHWSEALAIYDELARRLSESGSHLPAAAAMDHAAAIHAKLGHFVEALDITHTSEARYAAAEDTEFLGENLMIQAKCYRELGLPSKAGKCLVAASQIFVDEDNRSGFGDCMELLAVLHGEQHLYEYSDRFFESAERAFKECNDTHRLAGLWHDRGALFNLRGDHDQGIAWTVKAEGAFRKLCIWPGVISCILLKAEMVLPTDPSITWRFGREALRLHAEHAVEDDELRNTASRLIVTAKRRCNPTAHNVWTRLGLRSLAKSLRAVLPFYSRIHRESEVLLFRECSFRRCDNVGRFSRRRIIRVGGPTDQIVGWCEHCTTAICLSCAVLRLCDIGILADIEALHESPELRRVKQLCLQSGEVPSSPECPLCGLPLGTEGAPLLSVNRDLE